MVCKYLYADWCHNPKLMPQENCYWYLYGDMKNCNYYEEGEYFRKEKK